MTDRAKDPQAVERAALAKMVELAFDVGRGSRNPNTRADIAESFARWFLENFRAADAFGSVGEVESERDEPLWLPVAGRRVVHLVDGERAVCGARPGSAAAHLSEPRTCRRCTRTLVAAMMRGGRPGA